MLSKERINIILEKLKESSSVLKIVLFGSWAWGTPKPDSDIDVLIIEEQYSDKQNEIVRLKMEVISSEYSIDILLFTKSEYEAKLKAGWSLLEKIERDGIVFYAA